MKTKLPLRFPASRARTPWRIVACALGATLGATSHAATMDDYVTCGLVYGALFQAAKNSGHSGMIAYTRPRLHAVTPYLEANRDNPAAKAKLREAAIRLEDEVRYQFVQRATNAITQNDVEALRAEMGRVAKCDQAFGLPTFPLPITSATTQKPNKFLESFYEDCLAKQRSAPSPFNDRQLQKYCACMADRAKTARISGTSSEADVGKVVRNTHDDCLASIQ